MKRNVIIAVFFLFLIVIVPFAGFAQSASELGLVLTGKRQSTEKVIDGGDEIYLHYTVLMTFENKGHEPVIIINPTLGFGTGLKEASFSFRSTHRNGNVFQPAVSVKTFEPDRTKLENFKSMAQYFEGVKPPENMTMVVKPGERFSFEEFFYVELSLLEGNLSGNEQEIAVSRKKDAEGHRHALAYYKKWAPFPLESLQLTYEFSFLTHVSDADLLEKMSQRWRRYGRLPVGQNGTYTITSEKIK